MNTNAARNDWLMTTCLAELAATWQIINAIRERTIDTRVCLSVAWLLAAFVWTSETTAAEPLQVDFAGLADEYQEEIRPLMHQFCLGCHSSEKREGELDLEQFTTLTQVRRGTQAWLKVVEMLAAGEMPPGEAKQPPPEQRKQLRGWVERYLHAEALAGAGDPGPVVLRRLNNAEYTWTIRDLTGVNLSPAREFPTDSAAGEGFTNTGAALVMSPALLGKYLDAANEMARHAVLLPDGFRFSMQATRRDWTDEILAQLREFYRQSVTTTDFGVGSEVGNVNVHGNTRIGLAGRLPLEEYLAATLAERDALNTGEKTVESVASERGLNARYLGTLWSSLLNTDPSLLLDGLRSRWRSAKAEDAAALAAEVAAWQKGLWTFGPVGLIGRTGGPARWMESVNPLVTQDELRFTIPAPKNDAAPKDDEEAKDDEDANDVDPSRKDVEFSLMVTDAGDGNEHDYVVFQRPRLAAEGKPDVLLRDIEGTGLDDVRNASAGPCDRRGFSVRSGPDDDQGSPVRRCGSRP